MDSWPVSLCPNNGERDDSRYREAKCRPKIQVLETSSYIIWPEEGQNFLRGIGQWEQLHEPPSPSYLALGPFLQTRQTIVPPPTCNAWPPRGGPGFRESLPTEIKGRPDKVLSTPRKNNPLKQPQHIF